MRFSIIMLGCFLGACAGGNEDRPLGDNGGADQGEVDCQNSVDDDADGAIDCQDTDCAQHPACREAESDCSNGLDDDADGATDCQDPDCDSLDGCEFRTETTCGDGIDNDADLQQDCNDADCAGSPECDPETACDDGLDNDHDSRIDCLDEHCDGVGSCEFRAETSCDDELDNDGDGKVDCDDEDCGGARTCATLCPANSTKLVLDPTDVPLTMVDAESQSSTLSTSGAGIVTKVALTVDVDHEYTADVVLALESPAGTRVGLANGHGGNGDNYQHTLFVDSSLIDIADGRPPFAGVYRPDEPLDSLVGEFAAGAWTLHADDDSASISGTLDDWQLMLCVCEDCEVGAACNDDADNDGDGMFDCDDPDCSTAVWCIPETACDDGRDNDRDELIDCADDQCDAVGVCEFGAELSCVDGEDNDGDGAVDCADSDCAAIAVCIPEVDCHDGNDNDSDNLVDCLDPGCFGDPTCEPEGEVSCTDGVDNDSDGLADCDEPDCIGGLACVTVCPPDSIAKTFDPSDLPLALEDQTEQFSSLSASGGGVITQAAVMVDADHRWASDLVFTLESPSGARVVLADQVGIAGADFDRTLFSDKATASIEDGSAPFAGIYSPEQALSSYIGEAVDGTWLLHADDVDGGDIGTLEAWQLLLCVCESCEAGASCNDGEDNDNDGDQDCADPDCAATVWCIPETACDDGSDNDLDELIDCADDQCDGIGICEFSVEVSCDDGQDNDRDGAIDCADTDCAAHADCVPETDCHDGDDNDGDLLVDCLDPGCSSDPTCEPDGELTCTDGIDNDSDGLADCAEPSCALVCAQPACAGDEIGYGFAVGALGMAIPDEGTATTLARLAGAGTVTRTVVSVSIKHTYSTDLDISLISPEATEVVLSTDNGAGANDTYTGTIFSDASSDPIANAAPPYTGVFQPQGRLGSIAGQAAAGVWTLSVSDDSSGDVGTLEDFALALCVKP